MRKPENLLCTYNKKYPFAWKTADRWRRGRGKNVPDWPKWCFAPSQGWGFYVMSEAGINDHADFIAKSRQNVGFLYAMARDSSLLAALAAWRPSKGIYKFEPEIAEALIRTPINGNIPVESLLMMPAWCVFIDIQEIGLKYDGEPVSSFFVWLDHNLDNCGGPALRFLLDMPKDMVNVDIFLVKETLEESLKYEQELTLSGRSQMKAQGVAPINRGPDRNPVDEVADIAPFLSLVLFLCSDKPDKVMIGRSSKTKNLPKVSNGSKATPEAPQVTYYMMGSKMAREIRNEETRDPDSLRHQEDDSVVTSASKRLHFRRGHWHHFWTGPREPQEGEERKLVVKFLMPMLVGRNDEIS